KHVEFLPPAAAFAAGASLARADNLHGNSDAHGSGALAEARTGKNARVADTTSLRFRRPPGFVDIERERVGIERRRQAAVSALLPGIAPGGEFTRGDVDRFRDTCFDG